MRHRLSDEGKVALKIAKAIEGVTLDLDRVGIELARLSPTTHYNRLILIAEAAVEEQESRNVRLGHDPLF